MLAISIEILNLWDKAIGKELFTVGKLHLICVT